MFPIGVYQCVGVVVLLSCLTQTSSEVMMYMYSTCTWYKGTLKD